MKISVRWNQAEECFIAWHGLHRMASGATAKGAASNAIAAYPQVTEVVYENE